MDSTDKDRGMLSDQLLPVEAKPAFNDINIAALIYTVFIQESLIVSRPTDTPAAAAAHYRYVAARMECSFLSWHLLIIATSVFNGCSALLRDQPLGPDRRYKHQDLRFVRNTMDTMLFLHGNQGIPLGKLVVNALKQRETTSSRCRNILYEVNMQDFVLICDTQKWL